MAAPAVNPDIMAHFQLEDRYQWKNAIQAVTIIAVINGSGWKVLLTTKPKGENR